MGKSKEPPYFYILNIGPYPMIVIFCPNSKSWARAMTKHIGPSYREAYPSSDGRASYFPTYQALGSNPVAIITANMNAPVDTPVLNAIAVHECVHVFQFLCGYIGESDPSAEFEAYTIQALCQDVFYAMQDYKKTKEGK